MIDGTQKPRAVAYVQYIRTAYKYSVGIGFVGVLSPTQRKRRPRSWPAAGHPADQRVGSDEETWPPRDEGERDMLGAERRWGCLSGQDVDEGGDGGDDERRGGVDQERDDSERWWGGVDGFV